MLQFLQDRGIQEETIGPELQECLLFLHELHFSSTCSDLVTAPDSHSQTNVYKHKGGGRKQEH